jgi:hypothetical protein
MLEYRKNTTMKKMTKYNKKCAELRKKYVENEQSKIMKRSKSVDEL